jgi:hypothetical protein
MFIVDPFDDNQAIDDQGEPMCAVRWLPIDEDHDPEAPKVSDFEDAPIVGYISADGISLGDYHEI